jgi:Planctomycete cytochrome C/WD domain, G-beta repeat
MRLFPYFALTSLAAAEAPVFERDIAPILRSYCAGCHNDRDAEGDFSLETFAQLQKGADKGATLAPGKPEDSLLVKLLEHTAKPHMPPKDEPQVPAKELAVLKAWIAAGAPGPAADVSILKSLIVPQIGAAGEQFQPVTAAACAADGRLAVAQAGRVEIRSAAGQTQHTLTDLPGKVNALHFSPDGTRLVAASGIAGLSGEALVWTAADGKRTRSFGGARDVFYDAEFSPDGTLLAAAGYDRVIYLWNASDGTLLRSIDVHKGAIFDLAWHPSGKVLAAAGADETVKLWRVADGVRLDTLNQPQGEMRTVTFTADGSHIIAAGADKRLHLWKLVSLEVPALNPVLHSRFAHEAGICGLILLSDGTLISSADDRTLKRWSVPDLLELQSWEKQPDAVPVLAAVPGQARFFAGRMDGTSEVLSVKSTALESAAATRTAPHSPGAPPSPLTGETSEITEMEPNNAPSHAAVVKLPAEITGAISPAGDADVFRFTAQAGQPLWLEVNAARRKSKLDSRLEILHADGSPVEQVVLQATRDSWLTFRGKDGDTSDDFRVHNWAEMELNEYLYCNGEVVKLWLYPRGPDSGFRVYPGRGKRVPFFSTTAHAHALGQPCYTVTPLPAGTLPVANGLPVFRLNWENDDDSERRAGSDSALLFTAPVTGGYLARVTDVRGFGGEGFSYTLQVRSPRPDFSISIDGLNPKVSPGSGREFTVNVTRSEGFDGPVRVDLENLPAGFSASSPVVVEAGQTQALGVFFAEENAANPDKTADEAVKITARATIEGREAVRPLGSAGDIQSGPPAKVRVSILPADGAPVAANEPLRLRIHPGQTITARVRAERLDFAGRIELGGDDSGRNLPHGVFVDNIGLNGLLIVEGQTEREFQITASKIAPAGERPFYLRATADGGQASRPAVLVVE